MSKSFYLATVINLLKFSYANQSGLSNIDICVGFEKLAIEFLSSSFFTLEPTSFFYFQYQDRITEIEKSISANSSYLFDHLCFMEIYGQKNYSTDYYSLFQYFWPRYLIVKAFLV